MEAAEFNNPHDRFFRRSMERKTLAQELLSHFLERKICSTIDFSTFEIIKDIWVDSELSEHFADIIYKAVSKETSKTIYFLLEHKSFPDIETPFQNLRYVDIIWEMHIK